MQKYKKKNTGYIGGNGMSGAAARTGKVHIKTGKINGNKNIQLLFKKKRQDDAHRYEDSDDYIRMHATIGRTMIVIVIIGAL